MSFRNYCCLLFLLAAYSHHYGQLLSISQADTNSYYSADQTRYLLPAFELEKDQNQNIWLKGQAIFTQHMIPTGYERYHPEIFQNRFLFLTFLDSTYRGMSNPLLIARSAVYLIDLQQPDNLLTLDCKGMHFLSGPFPPARVREFPDTQLYSVVEVNDQEMTLLAPQGEKNHLPIRQIPNPLVP